LKTIELNEGILTEQGYEMKKKLILDTLTPIQQQIANVNIVKIFRFFFFFFFFNIKALQ